MPDSGSARGALAALPPRHKRAPLQIEPQRQIRRLRQADPRADNDWPPLAPELLQRGIPCNEQGGAGITQINAVQAAVDVHCQAQLARSIGQVPRRLRQPPFTHKLLPQANFHSPDQHCLRHSLRLANHIHTEVVTVNQIDVPVPRSAEHYPVTRRRPGSAVAGGITNQISLCLDNGSTAWPARAVANEPMPEQGRRNYLRRRRVKTPGERLEASHLAPTLYWHPGFPATCLTSPSSSPDRTNSGPNSRRGCQLPSSKRAAKINAPLHI